MSEGMLNKVAEHFNVGDLPRVAYHKVSWGEAKQEMQEYTEQNGSDRRYLKGFCLLDVLSRKHPSCFTNMR